MTTSSQSNQLDDIEVIDTPGLEDDGIFKILYAITLECGRIKPHDLQTINAINRAIKTDFQFGLVINKKIEELEVLLKNKDINKELSIFLKEIPSSFIKTDLVDKVDIRDYDQMVTEMESKIQSLMKESDSVLNKAIKSEDDIEIGELKGSENQHPLSKEGNPPIFQEYCDRDRCLGTILPDRSCPENAPTLILCSHIPPCIRSSYYSSSQMYLKVQNDQNSNNNNNNNNTK
ncbi:hypothetical protein PPL_06805 [Heterostelium album PN500]|uniref:Uncharacterized protein n=1 Tax=Heterostelium pallidum (strain ATCC 26659 / Pp 5 / PN500) TaxID=670386 RepID=D3BDK3_HETP5|nr:hypothetical protein PPL_06805 [Heterostelium album PN500]EFA79984.1 hypothetical protein PPL_06805 [Heterostelium album PN500]|eukprot:XP_020432104.1 hypothetical protein PPL_06805 [Heterostelium album PN500]